MSSAALPFATLATGTLQSSGLLWALGHVLYMRVLGPFSSLDKDSQSYLWGLPPSAVEEDVRMYYANTGLTQLKFEMRPDYPSSVGVAFASFESPKNPSNGARAAHVLPCGGPWRVFGRFSLVNTTGVVGVRLGEFCRRGTGGELAHHERLVVPSLVGRGAGDRGGDGTFPGDGPRRADQQALPPLPGLCGPMPHALLHVVLRHEAPGLS